MVASFIILFLSLTTARFCRDNFFLHDCTLCPATWWNTCPDGYFASGWQSCGWFGAGCQLQCADRQATCCPGYAGANCDMCECKDCSGQTKDEGCGCGIKCTGPPIPTRAPTNYPTLAEPGNQIPAAIEVFHANSANQYHPATNTIDGDRESFWQPDYFVDVDGSFVIYNLSYPSVIDEVIVDVRNNMAIGSQEIITLRVCVWEPMTADVRNPQSQCDYRYLSPRWDYDEPMHTWMVFDMKHFLAQRIDVQAYGVPFEIYSVWAIQGTAPPIPTPHPVVAPSHLPTSLPAPTSQPSTKKIVIEVHPESDHGGSLDTMTLIGIAVASFFGGLFICCLVCWLRKRRSGRFSFEYGAPENKEEKGVSNEVFRSRKRSMSDGALVVCPCFDFSRNRRYSSQIAPNPRGLNFDEDDDSDYIRKLRLTKERDERKHRVQYPELYSSSEGTVPARLVPKGRSERGVSDLPPVAEVEESEEYRTLLPDGEERIEDEYPNASEVGDGLYGTPDGLITGEGDIEATAGEEARTRGETDTYHVVVPENLGMTPNRSIRSSEKLEQFDLLSIPSIGVLPPVLPLPRGEPTEPEPSPERASNGLAMTDTEAELSNAPALSAGDSERSFGPRFRETRLTNSAMRRGLQEPLPSSSASNSASLKSNSEGQEPAFNKQRAMRQISPVYEDQETNPPSPPPPPPFSPGSPATDASGRARPAPPKRPKLPPRPKSWIAARREKALKNRGLPKPANARKPAKPTIPPRPNKRSGELMKRGGLLNMARPTPGLSMDGQELNI